MNTDEQSQAAVLADFVRDGRVFLLTGAGLSTDSGIPDYRRPDGTRRAIPMTFAEFRGSEAARRRYWIRSAVGWERFRQAQPNPGHEVIAAWQREGLLSRIVTQNVDGLHSRAGAGDVVELHGNLADVLCLECHLRFPRSEFQEALQALNPDLPHAAALLADGDAEVDAEWEENFVLAPCPRCSSRLVKPDVVMFGQNVEAPVVADCFAAVAASRAVLVLGSSLQVMSGYRFVLGARAASKPVALAGLGQMRGEGEASVVLKSSLTSLLLSADEQLVR